jgi:acyl carrier protein
MRNWFADSAVFRNESQGIFTVLDRTHSSAAERIAALVREFLAKRGIAHAIGRDDDLTASGLSSLDMVNLMLAVESEFAIKIPDSDMKPANFRNIARIDALVAASLQNA